MTNRRQYLASAGTAAAALLGVGASNAIAQNATPENIVITGVNADGEYFTVENRGDDPFDLTGYHLNFEYNGEVNQIREFGPDTTVPDGQNLTIPANSEFVVATGAKSVPDADVTFNYEGPVLNNDRSDTYAILTPDESRMVASSGKTPPTDASTPESGAKSTTTEADTPTATDTATAEADTQTTRTRTDTTSTPESGTQTATTTAEPTETATETSGGNATETSSEVDVDDGC